MATGEFIDKEGVEAIRDDTIVNAVVNESGYLILTKYDGSTVNAGYVKGSSTTEDVAPTPHTLVKRNATGQSQVANPEDPEDIATKEYVDGMGEELTTFALAQKVPSGVVSAFAGSTAPTGYLLCDGSAVSRTDYADLFTAIGTTYGAGNGSTTFNLPNLKGRVPVGRDSAQTEFDTLSETGGTKTVTLTESQMPSHTHVQNAHTHTQNSHAHNINLTGSNTTGGGSDYIQLPGLTATPQTSQPSTGRYTGTVGSTVATNQNTTAVNQNTGGGAAHNNLQPYIVMNYIIKI